MADDSAEEKVFDPSAKRLRQLRNQGQVPRSQDFGNAVSLLAVLFYVLVTHQSIYARLRAAFSDAPIFAPVDFWTRAIETASMMGTIAVQITAPVVVIMIMAVVLSTILDVGGFLFSLEPLTPNFQKFNPVEGVKNIFNLRSFIELLKSAIKIVILFACLYIVVRRYLNDAFWAPTCGIPCVLEVALEMTLMIIAIGTALLIISAGVDLLVSRWIFTRDNRMTLTEMKREQKEDYGDPHVRQARRRERQEMAQSAGLVGRSAANLWFVGPAGAVGIAYKPDLSGVPIVAAKSADEGAQAMIADAQARGVAVVNNPDLVATLIGEGRVGRPIPNKTFTPVAQALVAAGFSG